MTKFLNKGELKKLIEMSLRPLLFMHESVQTLHPTDGIQPFPQKAYIDNLVCFLQSIRLGVVAKSRQMFVTWLSLSLLLWKAIFEGPGLYLVLSRNERSSKELLERVAFIMENLVGFNLPEIGKQTREEISFLKVGSRIISLPATPDTPRMHSPKGVLWDELAFTPYSDEIWAALKPCIDSGGFFWGVSTSAGPAGLFAKMAQSPEDFGIERFWLHYSEDPDKNSDWVEICKKGLSEAKWRREYEISFEKAANAVYEKFDFRKDVINPLSSLKGLTIYRAVDWGFVTPVCLYIGVDSQDNVIVFDEIIGDRWTLLQFIDKIKVRDRNLGIKEKEVHFTACDPAGKSPGETGVSPVERMTSMGFKLKYRSSKIMEGVDLIRQWLEPAGAKLKITNNCDRTINDIQGYEIDDDGETPVKDGITDHTMDSLRYFFVNRWGVVKKLPSTQPRVASSG